MNTTLKSTLAALLLASVGYGAQAADAAYGTLNPASGGYPADIWAKSSGRQVERLLQLLPETVLSPSTHELLRRTLLTRATAPGDVGAEDFARARVAALLKIGDASDAGALLRTVPQSPETEQAAEAVAGGEFSADHFEDACLDVRSYAGRSGDAYWKRAMVVCDLQIAQRDKAAADAAALSDDAADPGFAGMARSAAAGQPPSLPESPTPLDVALVRVSHAADPASLTRSDDPLVLAGVARNEANPAPTRVEAGYAAAVQSGFGANEMLQLFRLPGAQNAAGSDPSIAHDDVTGSMADAAHRDAGLVQQTEAEKDGLGRVQRATKMLTTDAETADIPLLARVEFLKQLTMTTDRSALAAAAARGLFIEGDVSAAARWYDIAKQAGTSQPIWPLAHIAFDDFGSAGSSQELQQWSERTIAGDKDNGAHRVERVLSALAGLGEDIPASLWGETIGKPDDDTSIMGSMGISAAMSEAARIYAQGEVVVLVALSLKDGPGHAHPMNLNHAVGALWHVGMRSQAKAVALEGLAPVTMIPAR